MRVVQASKAYWPHLGGVETVVRDLALGIRDRGWASTVVVAEGGRRGSVEEIDGVTVKRAPTFGRARSAMLAPTYPRWLLRERADVLHVHVPSVLPEVTVATFPRAVRKRFGRLVVSWHSDVVRQKLLLKGFAPALHRLLQAADAIVVATPNHVTTSAFLPAVAEKVTAVPFGIDPARYPRDEEAIGLNFRGL